MAFRFDDCSICCLLHGPAVIIQALCSQSLVIAYVLLFTIKNLSVTQKNATFHEDATTKMKGCVGIFVGVAFSLDMGI